jgi:RNA polymerase sigma-70 factor (ECF subfamily)
MNGFSITKVIVESPIPKTVMNYLRIEKDILTNLLLKSKDGDSQSFSEISNQVLKIFHSYFLSKYHLKKIDNREDVDDLAHNVYLSFAEQYQKIQNLQNWLRRVLFITFVKWYKRKRTYDNIVLKNSFQVREEIEDRSILLDISLVLGLLEKLTEVKQQIIKLRFLGGLRFSEIARILNKKDAAVKKMFYRALLEIRNKIE